MALPYFNEPMQPGAEGFGDEDTGNKRFSGSANLNAKYIKTILDDPTKLVTLVRLCSPPFRPGAGENDYYSVHPNCDDGKTCLCGKPASQHPGCVWVMSGAGWELFLAQTEHYYLRSPDAFNMISFNDHTGCGVMEVLENLMLDFDRADGALAIQWAICEVLGCFLQRDEAGIILG